MGYNTPPLSGEKDRRIVKRITFEYFDGNVISKISECILSFIALVSLADCS